jgi:Family of unknown function (DUF7033)
VTLRINIPITYTNEVRWVVEVLFQEFLGVDYEIVEWGEKYYCLDVAGNTLQFPDCFFDQASSAWLHPASIPDIPLSSWDVASSGLDVTLLTQSLPVLFGKPEIDISENHIHLGVDIFGSAFFMLSRYEEVVLPDRDKHNRFPATASLSYKAGFLARPIIDEYVEILWAAMKHLWPGLNRKNHQGKINVTCDVDAPYDCASASLETFLRTFASDVLKRCDGKMAYTRFLNYFASKWGNYRYDPYNTFDWFMCECERAGRKASFYFIPDNTAGVIDGCYAISESRIRELLRDIDGRGHEVGVHGSYGSYQSASQIRQERNLMIEACEQAGVDSSVSGNRQHFLRWDAMQTPDYLDAVGFEYDTTGSFADVPGFRYGTSRTFTMWSWRKKEAIQIKQRPLILMESSVIGKHYMGLGYTDEAMEIMLQLKQRALAYGGDFTLLWHNSHLTCEQDRKFFKALIA